MSYATFLVHMQADADGEARVRLAADLAKRFEAMLIGVSARDILAPGTPPHAGMLVVKLIERQERGIAQELATAERSFRSIAQTGSEKVGWVSELDTPGRVLARESRAADIVVVGRNPHSIASSSYRSADPGDVLMHVKQIFLNTEARINRGAIVAKTAIDPTIVGAGIGYRFRMAIQFTPDVQ